MIDMGTPRQPRSSRSNRYNRRFDWLIPVARSMLGSAASRRRPLWSCAPARTSKRATGIKSSVPSQVQTDDQDVKRTCKRSITGFETSEKLWFLRKTDRQTDSLKEFHSEQLQYYAMSGASEASGTTKRCCHWSVTINNPTPQDIWWSSLKQLPWVKDVKGQLEKGEEGTTHIQEILHTNQVRFQW